MPNASLTADAIWPNGHRPREGAMRDTTAIRPLGNPAPSSTTAGPDRRRAEARSGSTSAEARMQALYDAHARPIYRYLLTLTFGQHHTAEDLLQETMMKVWCNIDALHPDIGRLRPWLLTVARNLAIDAGRARTARP